MAFEFITRLGWKKRFGMLHLAPISRLNVFLNYLKNDKKIARTYYVLVGFSLEKKHKKTNFESTFVFAVFLSNPHDFSIDKDPIKKTALSRIEARKRNADGEAFDRERISVVGSIISSKLA